MTKLCKGDSVHFAAARKAWPLAAALLSIPSGALAAGDTNQLSLFVDPDFQGGTGYNDQDVSGVGLLSLSGSATGGFSSSGDGAASVTYGIIKMEGEFFGSGDTESIGTYNDQITITASNVPTGTLGTLSFSISVSGTLQSLAGSSGASYELQANVGGGAYQISVAGRQDSPDLDGAYTGDPLGTFTGTATFYFGQATTLDVSLTGGAEAAYTGHDTVIPEANYDLAHSCYWQGISDVQANGVDVSNFTVTSLSGADYSKSFQAIPEPATFAPLALGVLLFRRGKRR